MVGVRLVTFPSERMGSIAVRGRVWMVTSCAQQWGAAGGRLRVLAGGPGREGSGEGAILCPSSTGKKWVDEISHGAGHA